MADLKATSFRISEDDLEKFKQFMEQQGIKTQADGFKSIMQSVEMAKAKNMITSRSKEIETFQETINNLMSYFINSLNVNQTSEERIREELSKELQTKDNTISTMYEQLQDLKTDKINSDNTLKDISNKNKELQAQLQKANNDNIDKNKSIDKLNSNNDLLQENLKEYKHYKDNYKRLEDELVPLKADQQVLKDNNNKLNNDNKQLNDKLNNNMDMIIFYKSEIDNKDKSINEYKVDIKVLEDKHKEEVLDVKDLYKTAMNDKIDQLNSKYEFELDKKNLAIEKLKSEVAQLKSKSTKKDIKSSKSSSEEVTK